MRESRVWAWINANKLTVPHHVFERVEVLTPPGMSDCMVTNIATGVTSWLELKFCLPNDNDFRHGRIPKLRPAQPLFLRARKAAGVKGAILLRTGDNPNHCEWRLWQSESAREWINFISGNAAISSPSRLWQGMPKLAEIVQYL